MAHYLRQIAFVVIAMALMACAAAEPETVARLRRASCDVFDPFRVMPDGNKYQIGGAFALHGADCLRVDAAGVQEIVGIQWALSHWNQRAAATVGGASAALGFFAGDSCARPKESVAQTLRFLDSVGFHEPRECARPALNVAAAGATKPQAKALGVLSPKDAESARALAGVLRSAPRLPIGVFGEAAAEELRAAGAQNVISTAPILDDYVEAILHFVRRVDSNLVAIVDGGEREARDAARTAAVADALRRHGVYVSEVIGYDHALLSRTLVASDARIILSLASRSTMRKSMAGNFDASLLRARKVWVSVEFAADGERGDAVGVDFFADAAAALSPPLPASEIRLQLVILKRQQRALPAFSAYFRRVLANNYASFALLSAFVEQRFNCTTARGGAGDGARQCAELLGDDAAIARALGTDVAGDASQNVHAALRLVYAFALAAERIENTPELRQLCEDALTPARCYDAVADSVLALDYEFGAADPADLRGERLRFMRRASGPDATSNGPDGPSVASGDLLVDASLTFEALFVERQGREGATASALFARRAADGSANDFALPAALRAVRSVCPPYRAICGNCEHVRRFDNDEIFLSNPRQYALYLAGIFDFHTGPNCEILHGGENIALPLAFSYALARPPTSDAQAAPGLDFGALLVDGCSSDRRVMEFLVESENGCYRFAQADRNWTVVAGATFGYISTSAPSLWATGGGEASAWPSVVERFFTSQNSPAPVVTLTRASASAPPHRPQQPQEQQGQPQQQQQQRERRSGALGAIFSAMPSHRSTASVLLKYLRRMGWDFLNLVVDEADADSVVAFAEFRRAAARAAVCVGDTLAFNSQAGAPARVLDTSANVTLVFAGARATADYLSARLRRVVGAGGGGGAPPAHVHVLVGDAHDFHLHDAANAAHYAGAVSVQPKDMIEPEFRAWLASVTPLSLPETWFWRYVEERWRCALSLRNVDLYQGRMCTGDELLNVPRMGRMTKAGYLAKSTRVFAAVAAKVHRHLCGDSEVGTSSISEEDPAGPVLCEAFLAKGRLHIRNQLAQIQFDDEFEVLEFQPIDHHGNFGYVMLANYSSRTGFHFLARYRPYVNTVAMQDANAVSRCLPPSCPCAADARRPANALADDPFASGGAADAETVGVAAIHGGAFARRRSPVAGDLFDAESVEPVGGAYEAWRGAHVARYALLAVTTAFCVVAAGIFALVVVKMYFRIVKGNQSLGITLLIGILGLYGTAYAYIAAPNETVCSGRVAAHAIAHTLCFGALLAKALQLRNAEALSAAGGAAYGHAAVSYLNYWLLMLFVVAVQAVLWLRWLTSGSDTQSTVIYAVYGGDGSEIDPSAAVAGVQRCSNSTPDFFLAEAYALVLLILALLLNALNRNIKRNYKEAKWLCAASLSCTIAFLAWIVSQALLQSVYADYATIMELYLTGTALLAFVFGPKIYVLISYEPIIVECKATAAAGDKSAGGGRASANAGEAPARGVFSTAGRHYDLFEADWPSPPDSRTISPSMSTRAGSPAAEAAPRRRPRSRTSDSNASGRADAAREAATSRNGRATALSPTALSSQSDASTSDSEALSSVLQTVLRKKVSSNNKNNNNNSNNNSNNNNGATVRRVASQVSRQADPHLAPPLAGSEFGSTPYATRRAPFLHHAWASYDPSAASHYGGVAPQFATFDAAAPFVVLPHVAPTFGATVAAAATPSARKKRARSGSQKSARI